MTANPIDMILPETFHRLKRTVLLFSAALFVLAIATPTAERELHSPFLDLKLATLTVQALLWFSGAYYLAGFILEMQSARRINSEAMRRQDGENIERWFETTRGRLQSEVATISSLIANAVPQFEEELARLRTALTRPLDIESPELQEVQLQFERDAEAKGVPIIDAIQMAAELTQGMKDHLARAGLVLKEAGNSDVLAERFEGWTKVLKDIESLQSELYREMQILVGRMGRLHRDITGARRASFWWWEVGGAAGAFAIATLASIPSVIASIRALLA